MEDSSLLFAATIEKFVKNILRAYVIVDGVVEEVNDDYTCDVTIQGTLYTSVPIAVLIGDMASFYPIPIVDTTCLITFRDGNRGLPQIIAFDQIDTLKVNCKTLVEFNGGENGGLPLSPNLVTRLNKIEAQQNQILDILKSIDIAATPFPFAPLFSGVNDLTPTKQSDIQSTVITQ